MRRATLFGLISALSFALSVDSAQAVAIGQIDDFEDGTTQGWMVNLLGMGSHPAPPANVPTGGPNGAGDSFLQLTGVGGVGSCNRLVAVNLAQWAGDYTAAGISIITVDLINLGSADLDIRLYLENPMGGPPTDDAVTDAFFLPAGGGWTSATFNVTAGALNVLNGDLNTLLSNVTALRIIHGPAVEFPPAPVVGVLGVDNITAALPEPSSVLLLGLGIAALALVRRRSQRRTMLRR
jgi:hypothetical protein